MLPIVFFHSGNIPGYLIRSVNQALIYNKNVVLITDTSSEHLKIKQYLIDQLNEGVATFEDKYVHMSSNSVSFELICIKRWFLLRNYMNKYNIDVCYYSDSDVMIYDNLTAVYSFYKEFDAAYTMTEYQENYRWSASACCSFWKRETINRFCDFILDLYSTSKIEKLKQKWNYHQQNNIPGGICDMTLLYLFTKEINFYPLSKVVNNFNFRCRI